MPEVLRVLKTMLSPRIRLVNRLLSYSWKQFSGQQTRAMSENQTKKQKLDGLRRGRLVWVDLEMSGLDIEKEHILEMACIVTDSNLEIIAESEDLVIHQAEEVLKNMDEWCTKQHGKSGLTEAVRKSKVTLTVAEERMLGFVQEHTDEGITPIAGNSVYMDRLFLMKYMPKFTSHLHYRLVDVSSIKELAKYVERWYWYPSDMKLAPKKKGSHRALDDIKDSIEELKFYRKAIFKNTNKTRPYIADTNS